MVEMDRTLIAVVVVIIIIILIILIAYAIFRERNNGHPRKGRPGMRRQRKHSGPNTIINYSQPGDGCRKACGCLCDTQCHCTNKHHTYTCKQPCVPVLNCRLWIEGDYVDSCGQNQNPQGSYHIQWHSQCNPKYPIIEYRIYASQGPNIIPTIENNDQIFVVQGDQFHFDTPILGFCWNFVVTAVNKCGESEPSEVYYGICV